MKRKPINARLRFLRSLTLVVALCFNLSSLYAQITVSTIVPTGQSEAINVGINSAGFTTTIQNSSAESVIISSIQLTIPVGTSIVANSMAATCDGTAINTTVNSSNIVTFSNYTLTTHKSVVLHFLLSAGCGAVPNAAKTFTINVKNYAKINYTYLGNTISKVDSTNSYPILFPGFSINKELSNNHKAVEWRKQRTDTSPFFPFVNKITPFVKIILQYDLYESTFG